jgi:hypothetical protein
VTVMHRPLCRWVARLATDGPGSAVALGPVNDGDDRSDARNWPSFENGWIRSRPSASRPGSSPVAALGLTSTATGETVVELDNFGRPVPVTESGLALVDRLEETWPEVPESLTGEEWLVLSEEAFYLRYAVLRRLVDEGQPADGLFHILPWHLVDAVAESVAQNLGGSVPAGEVIELQHWFTPAVNGVTGPLEQADAGLRVGDRRTVRRGLRAVLAGLCGEHIERIPPSTRAVLAVLVDAIVAREPVLRLVGDRARRGLVLGDSPSSAALLTAQAFTSRLAAAAAGPGHRKETTVLGTDGLRVLVTRTAGRRLEIRADVDLADVLVGDVPGEAAADWFMPIEIEIVDARRTLWIALHREDVRLVGGLDLALPAKFSVDVGGFPVMVEELASRPLQEILDSLWAGDYLTAEAWLNAAAGLSSLHPVKRATDLFEAGKS